MTSRLTQPLAHHDPDRLGDYRLVGRLGSGGMGTVYLARSRTGRTAALKTMHPRIAADPEFRTRFRLETDAARVIGGEHGAAVFDADPLAETPWLATEYVLGPPLDDAVSLAGPLPEACVRAVGARLCEALAQLHASDLVHRDLKPSNILLTASGVKVIDFGIARAIGDDRLTRTGAAAGTPAFMSPEQATGGEHTAAGDVFALAGVLVFAATGHGPFGGGGPADLLYRVRYGEADLTGTPDGLRPALERCLSKDPAGRPGTEELGRLLAAPDGAFADRLPAPVLADIARRGAEIWQARPERLPAPEEEPEETAPPAPARPSSRRRVLTLAGGAALLAGAGAGTWAWASGGSPSPEPDDGKSAGDRPPGVAPDYTWQVRVYRLSFPLPRATGDLVTVFSEEGLMAVDARGGERRWTMPDVGFTYELTGNGRDLFTVVGSGGTEITIAPVDLRSGVFRAPVVKETEVTQTSLLAATADTLYLTTQRARDLSTERGWSLRAYDLATGKERWRRPCGASTPSSTVGATYATVAGRHLVLVRKDTVEVRDARTGEKLWSKKIPLEKYDDGAEYVPDQIATDDRHLYIGSGELYALRLTDGTVSWRFGKGRDMGPDHDEGDRRYGPPSVRGGVVYSSEGSRGLVALDARSGAPRWEQDDDGLPFIGPSAPVVGRKYVYGTLDSQRYVIAVDRKSGRTAWTLDGPKGAGLGPQVAAHRKAGRLIVVSDGSVAAIPLE